MEPALDQIKYKYKQKIQEQQGVPSKNKVKEDSIRMKKCLFR